MSEALSQKEIDTLMNGSEIPAPFDQTISDIIGEVGNISMSQAATTLSSILNRRVMITTPRVSYVKFQQILDELVTPKVSTVVEFKESLEGSNLLLLNVEDAIIIADLMIGGDGNTTNTEFTELELSAVGEAMNQMIGSASTSMATMMGKKVDILPPEVNLWKDEAAVQYKGIDSETVVCKISFDLSVEGVIESEIMQIYTQEMVREISDTMLQDTAEVLEGREMMGEETRQQSVPTQEATKKVAVQQPEFANLENRKVESNIDNLDLLMDVPLDFSVVLGNSRKSIKDILSLGVGSVVELDKLTDEPLEVYVNSKLIAKGEVVVINENFGIRITNILSQKQRLNNLH
ncbi:flagellar motor switch phosphatase FliY [Vagococcus carniphilus]|uniref:flagellar motor switch phosphatase FliY n=1 Tax=Vagococcus carniphilus TaxID=218144 RepID=UPI0028902193|nr:flagellar motor switch phosphatase FliY [Vagococcus carniphilus]MDT2829642.1 flagellar motor switch phosphatase FliY [Vagococcus carniphilus]MDT2839101.1 flagellar motor switch phosphatase FliY [Vagococcus carniphilus]MDT2853159.1 flagellar motor switch phosphatase FliY [Vagococcus carniphilus]